MKPISHGVRRLAAQAAGAFHKLGLVDGEDPRDVHYARYVSLPDLAHQRSFEARTFVLAALTTPITRIGANRE